MKHTHIIHPLWRDSLIKDLTPGDEILFNQKFLTFSQAFFELDPKKAVHRSLETYLLLQNHKHTFKHLEKSLNFYETTQEILSFLDECDQFNIDLNQHFESDIDQDKITLLQFVSNHTNYRPYLHPHIPQGSYTIYPQYLTYFEQSFIAQHTLDRLSHSSLNPVITNYQALNKRQEVEGLAQWLLNNQNDECVILVGDNEYYPEIKRIFDTYGLSYSLTETSYSHLHLSTYYLVMFYRTQKHEFLLKYLKLENYTDLVFYLEKFNQTLFDEFNLGESDLELLDRRTIKALLTLEAKAKVSQAEVLTTLASIDDSTLDNLLISVFNSLRPQANKQELLSLKQTIENAFELLDNDYFETLFEKVMLQPISIPTRNNQIIVSNYRNGPFKPVKQLVLLGMTTHNFPAFIKKQGLYNEEFVSELSGYPTLEQRVKHHTSQMYQLLRTSENLIISTPIMDYQGKAFEIPLEIELLGIEFKKWPIIEPVPNLKQIKNLTPDLAQRLFFDEDKQLRGSVSSFETYFKNSYQYFIERGLRVKRPESLTIDSAMVGTINHAVMENLVQKKRPYSLSSKADIQQELNPYRTILTRLFNNDRQYNFILERLTLQIETVLKSLVEFEQKSPLTPSHFEYQFENYPDLIDHQKIIINGFVDRIDEDADSILIIDYKSSEYKLERAQVLNGRKLQLITYGMVISKLLNKTLAGVYYINMNNPYQSFNLTHYTTKDALLPDKSIEKILADASRLNGMAFNLDQDNPLLDLLKVRFVRNSQSLKPVFDITRVEKHFQTIYEHLYHALANGHLARYKIDEESRFFEMADLQRVKQHAFGSKTLLDYHDLDEKELWEELSK